MTDGHKHRLVTVKRDGLIHSVLTSPLYCTDDIEKADASPYPYGACKSHEGFWYLSALSILHRWTGLTLWFEDEKPPEESDDDD